MRTAKALCSLAGSGGVINRCCRRKGAKNEDSRNLCYLDDYPR